MPDQLGVTEEPECLLPGSYRGVAIAVISGQRNAARQPSSWASADIRYGSFAPPKREPLPPIRFLASLGAVPPQWHAAMQCTMHTTGGCTQYMSHVTVRSSACGSIGQLIRALERSNFDVNLILHNPAAQRCSIGANTKLKPGGGDWIDVGATLTDELHHTSKGALWISSM